MDLESNIKTHTFVSYNCSLLFVQILGESVEQNTTFSETKLEVSSSPKIPRRFSETIAIDHKPLLEEMSLEVKLPQPRLEKSEVSLRSDSLPKGLRMEVQIKEPAPNVMERKIVALKQRAEAISTQRQEMIIPIRHQRSNSETSSFKHIQLHGAQTGPQTKITASQITLQQVGFAPQEMPRVKVELQKTRKHHTRHEVARLAFIEVDPREVASSSQGSPPKFTGLFQSLRVMDGEQVKFSCVVRGVPTPDVIWYHNDKVISDNPDFVTKYNRDTGEVQLQIVEVFPQDTGVYNCVATNKYGNAVNTAQLRVEGIYSIYLLNI